MFEDILRSLEATTNTQICNAYKLLENMTFEIIWNESSWSFNVPSVIKVNKNFVANSKLPMAFILRCYK